MLIHSALTSAVRTQAMRLVLAVLAAALLAVVAAPLPAAAQATRPTFTVPASIDATGGRDVTAELLAFFGQVPDGSTVLFQERGLYRVEGTLLLEHRLDLVFEGNGATIFATTDGTGIAPPSKAFAPKWPRKRAQWALVKGGQLVFRNIVVRGANPNAGLSTEAYVPRLEAQHGFDVAGVTGLLLDRVTVTDTYGDFVYLGKKGTKWTSDVLIERSTFERSGRQGIALTAAEKVVISGNRISGTRRATFDLEPNGTTWGVRNVEIKANEVGPGRLLFVAAGGSGPVDDVSVVDNVLRGRSMNSSVTAPAGTRRSGFRFVGNRSNSTYGSPIGAAISFARVDDIEVRGNQQALQRNRKMVLVRAFDACRVDVANNALLNSVGQARVVAAAAC